MNQNKKVRTAVVLINWNGAEFTIPCIASIKRGHSVPDWIIVVDNASKDGSPAMIKAGFPDVILICNEVNKGFAEGNNIGTRRALELGADYVWILNNDTLVAEDCLCRLLEAVTRMPEAACYTTKIYYDEYPEMLWYDGGEWHPLHRAPRHLRQGEPDHESNSNELVLTEFVSGCSMFITLSVIGNFGLFCGSFVAYNEDADFCMRLDRAHQKLCYVKGAKIWHKVSASVKKNSDSSQVGVIPPYALFLMVRNNFWLMRRNLPLCLRVPVVALHLLIAVKMSLSFLASGNSKSIASIIKGVRGGLGADLKNLTPTRIETPPLC